MIEIQHLLDIANEFQRVMPIGDKTLSSRVFADSKKLGALREGSDITVSRFNDAVVWFSANWPAGAQWPDGLTRPVEPVQ